MFWTVGWKNKEFYQYFQTFFTPTFNRENNKQRWQSSFVAARRLFDIQYTRMWANQKKWCCALSWLMHQSLNVVSQLFLACQSPLVCWLLCVLSSVITFYHGACGRAPWRSWSRCLDFSVFANGKWAFSEYISLTPWPVNILDSLVCAGCVRCISRFTFCFQQSCADGMEHIWEKCVRNFPAVGPLLLLLLLFPPCSITAAPIRTHDRINSRDCG